MTKHNTLTWSKALAPLLKDGELLDFIDDAFCYIPVEAAKPDGSIKVAVFADGIPSEADSLENTENSFPVPEGTAIYTTKVERAEHNTLVGFVLDLSNSVMKPV